MKKVLIIIVLMFFFISPFIVNANQQVLLTDSITINESTKSAILFEPKTATVIYEKESKKKLPPASMTKLMTMLLVCEAIEDKVLTTDQMLTASKYATSMGGTQIYLEENEQMSVDDLLKSVALASANDAAIVLAEAIGGTCSNFVNMMNKKAEELGCVNSNFVNPNGLPEDGHYSCAYDMALIGSKLLNNYEDLILPYTSLYEDYVREDLENRFWLVNTNKLVKHVQGIDGLKTGWTEEAGYCLTCTMKRNNVRMVSVVMGAESIDNRTTDTLNLLNYGVNNFSVEKVYCKNDVVGTYEDIKLSPNEFHIVISEDVYTLKQKGQSSDDNNYKYEINIDESKIGLAENVGCLVIKKEDKIIKKVDLIVLENVEKANIISILLKVLKEIFLVS